ncbi:MAG: hypothetical protein LBV58_00305 [Acholeplasmatales bacterium]|nr:hypothetical protein [Acholeplasmatales bacterium]
MSKRSSDGNLVGCLALFSLFFWAIVQVFGLFHIFQLAILSSLSNLFMLIAMGWSAYLYSRRSKVLRNIFIFIVVVVLVLWVFNSFPQIRFWEK